MVSRDLPGERVVRRKGNLVQGQALETLGHAIEYLIDSRMFLMDQAAAEANREAVAMLMRLSRAVFLECAEVVPLRRRVTLWLTSGVSRVRRQSA